MKVRFPLFLRCMAHVSDSLHYGWVFTHCFPVATFGYAKSTSESVSEEARRGQPGINSPHIVADREEQIAAVTVINISQILKPSEWPELVSAFGYNVSGLASKRKIVNMGMENSLPKLAVLKNSHRAILIFNEFARSLMQRFEFFEQFLDKLPDSRQVLLGNNEQVSFNNVIRIAEQVKIFGWLFERIFKGVRRRIAMGTIFSNIFFREIGCLHSLNFTIATTKFSADDNQVRSTYLSLSMTEPFYRYKMTNNPWQGRQNLNLRVSLKDIASYAKFSRVASRD
jgi:hypothetical protein